MFGRKQRRIDALTEELRIAREEMVRATVEFPKSAITVDLRAGVWYTASMSFRFSQDRTASEASNALLTEEAARGYFDGKVSEEDER